MKLTFDGISALWNLLMTSDVTGRSEARDHAKITRAFKEHLTEGDNGAFKAKGGTLNLDDDRMEYLRSLLEDAAKKRISGALAVGYDELYETIMPRKKEEDAAPESASTESAKKKK